MVLMLQKDKLLLLLLDDKIIVSNLVNSEVSLHTLPPPSVPPNLTKCQEAVINQENRRIVSARLSEDHGHLAVALSNRQLVVYGADFCVVANILTLRTVSSLCFSPEDDLVVADKTGDVYVYKASCMNAEATPALLLGHLSMILDITLGDCGKYVITSDRDEKIRVSRYPNGYNIVSYCLGHTEFVSNVAVVGRILISASGDGTLKFWHYVEGRLIASVSCNDHVCDRKAVDNFCKQMDGENVEVHALPVIDMQVYTNDKTFIAVQLLHINTIQLYRMSGVESTVCVEFLQNVNVDTSITSFRLSNDLFVLSETKLESYRLTDSDRYEQTNSVQFGIIFDYCKEYLANKIKAEDVSVLYKRKFDNVQEYLDRKKLRLEPK